MTEYVPNINMPQKRVKIFIPSNSKLSRSTKPNTAQNNVCVVSNRLHVVESVIFIVLAQQLNNEKRMGIA